MTTKVQSVRYLIDEQGKDIVEVPLIREGKKAILYESDFDLLMELDCPIRWTLHLSVVKARLNKVDISVARLITDAGPNQHVLYTNGNKLDLRRNNLLVARGVARTNARHELARYLRRT